MNLVILVQFEQKFENCSAADKFNS